MPLLQSRLKLATLAVTIIVISTFAGRVDAGAQAIRLELAAASTSSAVDTGALAGRVNTGAQAGRLELAAASTGSAVDTGTLTDRVDTSTFTKLAQFLLATQIVLEQNQ